MTLRLKWRFLFYRYALLLHMDMESKRMHYCKNNQDDRSQFIADLWCHFFPHMKSSNFTVHVDERGSLNHTYCDCCGCNEINSEQNALSHNWSDSNRPLLSFMIYIAICVFLRSVSDILFYFILAGFALCMEVKGRNARVESQTSWGWGWAGEASAEFGD